MKENIGIIWHGLMKKNYKTLQKSVKRFLRNYILRYSELTWNIYMQLDGLDTDEWLVKPTKVLQVVGNWREWKNQRQFIEDKSKQKNTCSEQWSPDNSVFRIMGTFGNQIVWLQNNIYWHAYNSVSLSSYDCFQGQFSLQCSLWIFIWQIWQMGRSFL